jgi:glycosyltransferase involved in cell wall biosynthesis
VGGFTPEVSGIGGNISRLTLKSKSMRFAVLQRELDCRSPTDPDVGRLQLDSGVSVQQQMQHFFSALGRLGEVIPIIESHSLADLQRLCAGRDVIFAGFHEEPPDMLSCRFLQHSKGSLLLPGGFLDAWTFHQSTYNILTSKLQALQLRERLGRSDLRTGVLVPRLNEAFVRCYEELPQSPGRRITSRVNLVYAGRFIANKGICQAIRALNLWPFPAHLTLIGSYEPNFPIQWCDGDNSSFPEFFQREYLAKNANLEIRILKSLRHERLAAFYKSADVFVYPSFHEDENFGMAPREAILCGLKAVASDFCGLGEVGRFQGRGNLKTFPTLAGIRFSLWELRNEIKNAGAVSSPNHESKTAADKIYAECNESSSIEHLRLACERLLSIEPSAPQLPGWRSKERFDNWISKAPASFQSAVSCRNEAVPEGLYPYGVLVARNEWFSTPHFFRSIQSLYTTLPTTPRVTTNAMFRGFWRVALLEQENAIVEFGYPGPRYLRLPPRDWNAIRESARFLGNGELEFFCMRPRAVKPLQQLVDLGYLVPDIIPN